MERNVIMHCCRGEERRGAPENMVRACGGERDSREEEDKCCAGRSDRKGVVMGRDGGEEGRRPLEDKGTGWAG